MLTSAFKVSLKYLYLHTAKWNKFSQQPFAAYTFIRRTHVNQVSFGYHDKLSESR